MDKHALASHLYGLAYRHKAGIDYGWHNFWVVFKNGWKLSVLPPVEGLDYIEIAVINPEGNRIDIDGEHAERALESLDELNEWAEKVANYA